MALLYFGTVCSTDNLTDSAINEKGVLEYLNFELEPKHSRVQNYQMITNYMK